jgi:hypothetical protein
MPDTTISKYLRILEDERRLKEIGKDVVRDSIRRAMMEKIGVRDDDVALVLKKGDRVPVSMRNEPEIVIDRRGNAAADWCKAWCKGGDWGGNCWGKCTEAVLPWEGGFHAKTKLAAPTQQQLISLLIEENFSAEEIKVLKKYKFI